MIETIFNDKPALCRIFNIVVGCKVRSRNLNFQLRPYEGSFYILISPKRFGVSNIRSTVHVETNELSQLQIRELASGTHYINHLSCPEKLRKFILSKKWINENDRYKKLREMTNKKERLESEIYRTTFFN